MRRAVPLIALSMLAGCASVPDQPNTVEPTPADIAEMCAKVQCGYDIRIELKEKDGGTFSKVFDAMPVVQPLGVSVYAGNTVYVEADVADDRLVNLRLVPEVIDPARTITSRLEQIDDGGMMLTTHNPFDRHLRIRMGMMPLDREWLVKTSSCPVIAGGASFETWPFPIFQILLADMRLMDTDEPMACIE